MTGLKRNLRQQADGRWRWHWDPSFLDGFEPDHSAGVARYTAAARRTTVPTLLVRGGKSSIVTPATVQHFRELMPHAEYANVAFNDAVLRFLDAR